MIAGLVLAELRHRPGRALFLLAGYAMGVATMVVLLAVGEAMLEQARDRALVGGGDVVILPAGMDPEMLKSGGAASLYLNVANARFLQRQVLESPRARQEQGIVASSPLLDQRLVELTAGGRAWNAMATGEIPSRAKRLGTAASLLEGEWRDSEADRRWVSPSHAELLREIDRFHIPSVRDSTWAEWHYFNVVLDERRWMYITLMVAGEVGVPGRWGGRVLLTTRDADGSHRSRTLDLPGDVVRFDTLSPDLSIGDAASVRLEGDVYHVRARARGARVDLRFRPAPRRYFPPVDLGGSALVSGYVAPALHAEAEGTVCLPRCEDVRAAQGYHDHNWGIWRDVSWEWGAASDPEISLLYGAVRGDTATDDGGMFAALMDGRGARGLYRPGRPRFDSDRAVSVAGRTLRVPTRIRFEDPRGGLAVDVSVSASHVTDLARPSRRFFVQMRGIATVREHGRVIGHLPGFFETYLD